MFPVQFQRLFHVVCGRIFHCFIIDYIRNVAVIQCLFQPFGETEALNAAVGDNQHTFIVLICQYLRDVFDTA